MRPRGAGHEHTANELAPTAYSFSTARGMRQAPVIACELSEDFVRSSSLEDFCGHFLPPARPRLRDHAWPMEPSDRARVDWKALYESIRHQSPGWRAIAKRWGATDEDAEDLMQSFFLDRLPEIAPIVSHLDSDRRARYIAGAFRNFVIDAARARSRHERALALLASAEGEGHEDLSFDASALNAAVQRLPPRMARAVRAYLGVDGPTESIREIAIAEDVSRHTARQLVLDGILLAAASLGESGAVDPRDLRITAKLLRGEGRASVAASERMTEPQVEHALRRARAVVANAIEKGRLRHD